MASKALHDFGQQTGRHGRCMGPRRGICGEKRQGLKQRHAVTSHDTGKTMGKAWEKPRKIRVEWILGRTFRQFVSGNEKYSDDERGVNGFSWCFCQVSIDFNGNFNETIPMSLFSSMQCLVIAYSHTNTLIAMKIGDSNGSTLYWICSMMEYPWFTNQNGKEKRWVFISIVSWQKFEINFAIN